MVVWLYFLKGYGKVWLNSIKEYGNVWLNSIKEIMIKFVKFHKCIW